MANRKIFYPPLQSEPPTHLKVGDDHYEAHVVPNPSYPFIYHRANAYAMPHWHENIEILYSHGNGGVICDRESYEVQEHDIIVFNSNTLHAVPEFEGVTHACLIVDGAFLERCDIVPEKIKFNCVVRDPEVSAAFLRVAEEVEAMRAGEPYGPAGVKAAILDLVVRLCRDHSISATDGKTRVDGIKRAIGYIKANFDEALTVEKIASAVNMSKYYFCREFHRETGLTVVKYINNLRCREAEKLLHRGKYTVSEVARMCGFENLSYFTRTYKSIIGCTPSDSRAKTDAEEI